MTHIATVQLQDYFQHKVFETVIAKRHWSRFESRLRRNLDDTLGLLDRYNAKATFFPLGWIAEQSPQVVQEIAARGHEIASAGFWGLDRLTITQAEFREDLRRGKHVLQEVTGREILGYRSIRRSLSGRDLWHLDLIAEEGYRYDSSLMPSLLPFRYRRSLCRPFVHQTRRGPITELPHATASLGGLRIPVGGGNYLRQLPTSLTLSAFRGYQRSDSIPFVLYFHPWELDPEQPEVSAFGALTRIRQYRNLGRLRNLLPRYFESASFGSAAAYLGMESQPITPERATAAGRAPVAELITENHTRQHVTVVIPCHNEAPTTGFLARALEELSVPGAAGFRFRYILVDDKSTDNTLEELGRAFGDSDTHTIIALESNQGVAGAIQAGIAAADTEIVCSVDADCSYDPLELLNMISQLEPGVAMVTASPYHAEGAVLGVPRWRLFLSRGLSGIYRVFLTQKLATYTSCFRVYRRSVCMRFLVEHTDFRGIVELLAKLDMAGEQIVEYPTTLQSRVFGHSKMKTLKTIRDHLRLLVRMPVYRREVAADGYQLSKDKGVRNE